MVHLFSNWKWTGPAEHVLNLALDQKGRSLQVHFVCATPMRGGEASIEKRAKANNLEFKSDLLLSKHLNFKSFTAYRLLKRFLLEKEPHIVHTHLTNDHLLGGAACRKVLPQVPVVRTSYDGEGMARSLRNRHLLSRLTDLLLVVSQRGAKNVEKRFSFPSSRMRIVQIPVDVHRFDPRKVSRDLRPHYGIDPKVPVVGIVARVQRHRRFEVLLEAVRRVVREVPELRLMIIGRGTHLEEVAVLPAKEKGLERNVVFPGYRTGDYVETLASINVKVFLVPGSDGSCRAVREAMAMEKPVIAACRGMLPEIVVHGETGLIVDDSPENLARAILRLVRDPVLAEKMGKAGRKRALKLFSREVFLNQILDFYHTLLEK